MYSILPNCFLFIIQSLAILNNFFLVCFETSVFQKHSNLFSTQYLMLHYHIKQGTSVKPISEDDGILLLLNSLSVGEGGSSWASVCFTGHMYLRWTCSQLGRETKTICNCSISIGCRGIYFMVSDSQSHFPNNRHAFFLNYNLLIFHPFYLSFTPLWAGLNSFYLLSSQTRFLYVFCSLVSL